MEQEVKALMQAAAEGRLQETLRSHKVTPELGAAARQVFREACDARDGGKAMMAALVASAVYEALGDATNRVLNLIDFLQVEFMVADNTQQYKTVRERALSVLPLAEAAKSRQYAFYAMVLAADSAYFAAHTANDDSAGIVTALQDINAACDRADGFQKDLFFVRFIDLLATVVNISMMRMFVDDVQAKVNLLLSEISKKVEELVPPDFEAPGDPQQTSKIAAVLSQLTDKYAA